MALRNHPKLPEAAWELFHLDVIIEEKDKGLGDTNRPLAQSSLEILMFRLLSGTDWPTLKMRKQAPRTGSPKQCQRQTVKEVPG